MLFKVHRAAGISRDVLARLRALTNDVSRGDFRDDNKNPGSVFRRRIDEHLSGEERFPTDAWVVIAWRGMRIAGWSLVTRHHKDHEGLSLNVPTASAGFYVHPDFRRSGLGLSLVQEAQKVTRKYGMKRMLVNPWNARSHSFFKAAGFVEATPYVPGWTYGISYVDLT